VVLGVKRLLILDFVRPKMISNLNHNVQKCFILITNVHKYFNPIAKIMQPRLVKMVLGIKKSSFLKFCSRIKTQNGGTIIEVPRTTIKMIKTIIKNQWNSY
jgi:hypothetical protein